MWANKLDPDRSTYGRGWLVELEPEPWYGALGFRLRQAYACWSWRWLRRYTPSGGDLLARPRPEPVHPLARIAERYAVPLGVDHAVQSRTEFLQDLMSQRLRSWAQERRQRRLLRNAARSRQA